jgi:hypothetical protein
MDHLQTIIKLSEQNILLIKEVAELRAKLAQYEETPTKKVAEIPKSKRNLTPEGRAKMVENGKRLAARNKAIKDNLNEMVEQAKQEW